MAPKRNKLISNPKSKAKKGQKRAPSPPRPKTPTPPPPPPPPPPPKPLPAFTISWSTFFNKESIWGSSKVSNKFDFRAWNAEQNKRISDYSMQKGLRLIRYKGSALITCSGAPQKQDLELNDEEDWETVTDLAFLWSEEKRKNISVFIAIHYGNRPLKDGESFDPRPKTTQEAPAAKKRMKISKPVQLSSDDDDQGGSAVPDNNDNQPKKKKIKSEKKARASATSRQKKKVQERQEIDQSNGIYGMELMKRWSCDTTTCPNRTHYCWQIGGKHLKLFTNHIARWNAAIVVGEATVNDPPRNLKGDLYTMLMEGPKINQKKKDNDISAVTQAPITPIAAAPAALVPPFGYYPPSAPPAYPMFAPPASNPYYPPFYTPPWMHSQGFPPQAAAPSPLPAVIARPLSSEKPPTPPSPPPPQSSPVQIEGDAGRLLQGYISWQIGRNPSQQSALDNAFNQLQAELYELQDIRRFKDADWSALGIQLGLGKRLSREVKVYKMEYNHSLRMQQRNARQLAQESARNLQNPSPLDQLLAAAFEAEQQAEQAEQAEQSEQSEQSEQEDQEDQEDRAEQSEQEDHEESHTEDEDMEDDLE